MYTAISQAKFFTGKEYIEDQYLVFKAERLLGFFPNLDAFDAITILEYPDKTCLPGFIDLQVNGGAGVYFVKDFSPAAVASIAQTYRKYGTTSFFPTQVSTSMDRVYEGIESVKQAMQDVYSGVIGMHVEGPFLNPIKRGAHQTKYILKPTLEMLEGLIEYGGSAIGLLTIAPERFGDRELAFLRETGIRLSAGHSNATYVEAKRGFDYGIRKVTHLFNAMSSFQSREPGLVGAFLDSPEVYGGIIADGRHVDYASLRIAQKAKRDKLFFVTDSVFVDFAGDRFVYDGFDVRLVNGAFVNQEGNLAGAAITMQEAIYNSIRFANIPEADAFKMATAIPAEYLGLSDEIGYLQKDAFADLVILDNDYQIEQVFFKGQTVI
jgi:N-acetylglucosamine-6-phosphate deacetylase